MSGTTVTGGIGSTTTSGGSGSSTTTPTFNYVVTQPGNGYAVGTLISDAATVAELDDAPPSWAVRVVASQMGS